MKKNLLFLVCFVLLCMGVYAQKQQMSTYYYQRATLFEELPISSKDIVFLGNSITDGCEWNELFNNTHIKNRGISGDITVGVLQRLDPILKGKPSKLFLMIGVNDISRGVSADTITDNIAQIIREIRLKSPVTKVYLQSILPFDGENGRFKNLSGRLPVAVTANKLLAELADKEKITYIDLYSHFVDDSTGKLHKKYSNDGLHLMGSGYLLWRDLIRKYVDE